MPLRRPRAGTRPEHFPHRGDARPAGLQDRRHALPVRGGAHPGGSRSDHLRLRHQRHAPGRAESAHRHPRPAGRAGAAQAQACAGIQRPHGSARSDRSDHLPGAADPHAVKSGNHAAVRSHPHIARRRGALRPAGAAGTAGGGAPQNRPRRGAAPDQKGAGSPPRRRRPGRAGGQPGTDRPRAGIGNAGSRGFRPEYFQLRLHERHAFPGTGLRHGEL